MDNLKEVGVISVPVKTTETNTIFMGTHCATAVFKDGTKVHITELFGAGLEIRVEGEEALIIDYEDLLHALSDGGLIAATDN